MSSPVRFTGVDGPASAELSSGLQRVVHGFDASVSAAADDDVADPQRSVLHDQFRDDAPVALLLGFQAGTRRRLELDWPRTRAGRQSAATFPAGRRCLRR